MKLADMTELAARNLREAVLRNSLTTLGHCRGSGFPGGLAFTGSRTAATGESLGGPRGFVRYGVRQAAAKRPLWPAGRRQALAARRSEFPASAPLDDAARQEIAALPNVLEVNPEVRFTAEARHEPDSQLALVAGMAASSQSSGTLDGMNGKFLLWPGCGRSDLAGRSGQAPARGRATARFPAGPGDYLTICAAPGASAAFGANATASAEPGGGSG